MVTPLRRRGKKEGFPEAGSPNVWRIAVVRRGAQKKRRKALWIEQNYTRAKGRGLPSEAENLDGAHMTPRRKKSLSREEKRKEATPFLRDRARRRRTGITATGGGRRRAASSGEKRGKKMSRGEAAEERKVTTPCPRYRRKGKYFLHVVLDKVLRPTENGEKKKT